MRTDTSQKFLSSEISLLPDKIKKWSFRVALVFGDKYKIGMANLGFLTGWEILHKFPQIFAQRFFTNCQKSLEEQKELSSFEIILVSLPYEINFLNFVSMLRNAQIEPLRQRRAGETPIIIFGGCAPTINPLPYSAVADAIFIGQGQEYVEGIIFTIAQNPPSNIGKDKLLEMLSKIPGVWIPGFQATPPARASCKDKVPPVSKTISSLSAFPNMVLVQIQQGCPFSCPFCAVPTSITPFFNYTTEQIISSLEIWEGKASRVGLIGSAIADHPQIDKIYLELFQKGYEIYNSSIRIDRLKPHHIELFKISRQKTLTFAPESGSQKFKKIIGKNFDADAIISSVNHLPAKEIKLYYIIGLPDETSDDIIATINEIKQIRDYLKDKIISVSINAFIPKKGTLWENCAMDSHIIIKQKIGLVSKSFKQTKGFKLETNYSFLDRVQWALSCGNKEIGEAVAQCNSASELRNRLRTIDRRLID